MEVTQEIEAVFIEVIITFRWLLLVVSRPHQLLFDLVGYRCWCSSVRVFARYDISKHQIHYYQQTVVGKQ